MDLPEPEEVKMGLYPETLIWDAGAAREEVVECICMSTGIHDVEVKQTTCSVVQILLGFAFSSLLHHAAPGKTRNTDTTYPLR